jgi:hypothetical protein
MELLGREERKFIAQIESRLRTEDRQCPRAGAIVARLALIEDKAQEVVILAHERT